MQPPSHRRRPPTRSHSTSSHQRDQPPPPKNATEVRSFLGLAGYYRRYVTNFAAIAGPLTCANQEGRGLPLGPGLPGRLRSPQDSPHHPAPSLPSPTFSFPFRLYANASASGLGAILAQAQEGKERIICCMSRRSLNQAEKAYPSTKLECLAIVWNVAKFQPYLMSMTFEVYTDHYALQWLKTMHTGSALLHRWSAAPGGIRLHGETPPREVSNTHGWTQSPARRSFTSRRCDPASASIERRGRGPQDCL